MIEYFFVIEMSYLIIFFQMIEGRERIFFYVIVIEIFNHFPEHTHTY